MRRLIFTFGLGLALIGANAQTASPQLVSSAGDSFNNTSYRLDWSIGECVTETHSAGTYIITQGFHQNTYIITAVEDFKSEIEMSVYPNPTSDFITLNFSEIQNAGKVSYSITDLSGKVLQTADMKSDFEQIDFSTYANGTYLISISENNKQIKSFQIIKK